MDSVVIGEGHSRAIDPRIRPFAGRSLRRSPGTGERRQGIDVTAVRLSAHRANISRYRRLLRTQLTPGEREYLLRRLREEEAALYALQSSGKTRDARAPWRPAGTASSAGKPSELHR